MNLPRILFLFGAGASYGAGSIAPERPPLGAELFRELRRVCPRSWGALPTELAQSLETDFEAGMALVTNQLGTAVPMLMRDMAVYFVQFRSVNKSSLYDELISALEARSMLPAVAFSTLNYECILDHVLAASGNAIDYFGNAPGVPLLKLHGSCNMFIAAIRATPGVLYTPGVVFEGGIQATLDRSWVVGHCLTETALAPVMCQYMFGKPTSVSPAAIKDIQARWATVVNGALIIVCIGVRPNPSDTHVWGPLAAAKGSLFFVGDQASFEEWTANNRGGPSKWLATTFARGFHDLIETLEQL